MKGLHLSNNTHFTSSTYIFISHYLSMNQSKASVLLSIFCNYSLQHIHKIAVCLIANSMNSQLNSISISFKGQPFQSTLHILWVKWTSLEREHDISPDATTRGIVSVRRIKSCRAIPHNSINPCFRCSKPYPLVTKSYFDTEIIHRFPFIKRRSIANTSCHFTCLA